MLYKWAYFYDKVLCAVKKLLKINLANLNITENIVIQSDTLQHENDRICRASSSCQLWGAQLDVAFSAFTLNKWSGLLSYHFQAVKAKSSRLVHVHLLKTRGRLSRAWLGWCKQTSTGGLWSWGTAVLQRSWLGFDRHLSQSVLPL